MLFPTLLLVSALAVASKAQTILQSASGFNFLGCYSDGVTRIMNGTSVIAGNAATQNAEQCLSTCVGNVYAGLEHGVSHLSDQVQHGRT